MQSRCGTFRSFVRTALQKPCDEEPPHTLQPVWPLPFPYPEMVQGTTSLSTDLAWRRFANVLVLALNWLHFGRPPISNFLAIWDCNL